MAIVPTTYQGNMRALSINIANGQTNSDDVNLGEATIVGVIIPVALTGATLAFHGSFDGVSYFAAKEKDGTAITIATPTATGFYKFQPALMDGMPYVRLVSGSAEGALRTIQLIVANYKDI